jgi:hypothetical protein
MYSLSHTSGYGMSLSTIVALKVFVVILNPLKASIGAAMLHLSQMFLVITVTNAFSLNYHE